MANLSADSRELEFHQVDVFATGPLSGNPLAVVVGADALSGDRMQAFANWTNLSETTFLMQPTEAGADYRVRIFTPDRELPFAGHPTLGSAAVWAAEGGTPKADHIVQDCQAGAIRVRQDGGQGGVFWFAAPDLIRSGPVDAAVLQPVCAGLGITPEAVLAAQWVDNGPGWMALLLRDRDAVLSVTPDFAQLKGLRVGIVGRCGPGDEADFELRAFTAAGFEDPVTGSLNAGVAQWLIEADLAPESYVARQGSQLGRRGAVHVEKVADTVWIGGQVQPRISGVLRL